MKAQSMITGPRYMSALALSMSCLVVTGCGGGGGSSSETTAAAPAPRAEITVDQAALGFGKVVIGQTSERTLSFTNTGDRSLINFSLTDPGAPFSVAGSCPEVFKGETCDITVEFSPADQQDYSASFTIDANAPAVAVDLSGTGQGLNVEISNLATSCVDPTVTARVVVTDASGSPITVLDVNNFLPALGGAPIDPFNFTGITNAEPLSVALTVDWSESLSTFRPTLTQTSDVFIDTLDNVDTAAFYRFARGIDRNAQFFVFTGPGGKDLLKNSVFSDFDGDPSVSSVWESANYAVDNAAAEPNPNRIVLLITDGLDNSNSAVTVQDVIDNAVAKQVNVFTLGFGDDIDSAPLEQLAQETGGLYFFNPDAQGLSDIYNNIVSILTNQYEIDFGNPDLQAASELTVRIVNDQGLEGEDTVSIAACP